MLGWRGRLGYVSPSNIQLPWDLQDMLPEGVGVVATVLNVRAHTEAEFQRASQRSEAAVGVVVGEGAQAVVLGGVPLAVRQGYERERQTLAGWNGQFDVPVISGMAAAAEGLRHLGAKRPVLATAYLEEINQAIAKYLDEAGFDVAGIAGLAVRSPAEASKLDSSAYYHLAKKLVSEHPEADSIFIGSRGGVQAVLQQLEDDLELPVVSGLQAGVWWAMRQMRIANRRPGFGRLLLSPAPRQPAANANPANEGEWSHV